MISFIGVIVFMVSLHINRTLARNEYNLLKWPFRGKEEFMLRKYEKLVYLISN